MNELMNGEYNLLITKSLSTGSHTILEKQDWWKIASFIRKLPSVIEIALDEGAQIIITKAGNKEEK